MPYEFKTVHRVGFSETDLAGIVHFSNFFRYLELAEHAFFRSLGFSIHMEVDGRRYGWPRVHAECDYRSPLRFEDEVEVHLRVREKKERSLTYDFVLRRLRPEPEEEVARAKLVVVCVAQDPESGRMRAVPIPEPFARLIETAPDENE